MLPKSVRLKNRSQIVKIIKYGHKVTAKFGYFKYEFQKQNLEGNNSSSKNGTPSKFALIIGKKVHPKANKRIKVKRWLRAAIIQNKDKIPLNYNIVYYGTAMGQNFSDYENEVKILTKALKNKK